MSKTGEQIQQPAGTFGYSRHVAKTADRCIRIAVREHNERLFLNIREMVSSPSINGAGPHWQPTNRGVSIALERLPEVVAAIDHIADVAEALRVGGDRDEQPHRGGRR